MAADLVQVGVGSYVASHRTKRAIFPDSGDMILIAITPEAIAGRAAGVASGRAAQAAGD